MGAPTLEVLIETIGQVSPRKQQENVKSARDGFEQVRVADGAVA